MNIFCIGDVTGKAGCQFLRARLPAFKRVKGIDLCIVNGENSAFGNGIGVTRESAESLFASGADVITTGNHVYKTRDVYDFLDENAFITRPANFYKDAPGNGYCIVDMGRCKIAVMNLSGTVYLDYAENPFSTVERLLEQTADCTVKLLDFHAEATSEKRAMGYLLDGRVSAVFGTHTHVQTADDQVLPKGTGYITDLGMTGPVHSVLGMDIQTVLEKFRTNLPTRFVSAQGECMLCGCIFAVDTKTGLCTSTERVCIQ